MAESKFLSWIRHYRNILSISGLEQYLGLPATTINRYLTTGNFPRAHREKMERGMEEMLGKDSGALGVYATSMVENYEIYHVKFWDKVPGTDPPIRLMQQAQLEQMMHDIMRLYISIHQSHPLLAENIYAQMDRINPGVMEGLAMILASPKDSKRVLEAYISPGSSSSAGRRKEETN